MRCFFLKKYFDNDNDIFSGKYFQEYFQEINRNFIKFYVNTFYSGQDTKNRIKWIKFSWNNSLYIADYFSIRHKLRKFDNNFKNNFKWEKISYLNKKILTIIMFTLKWTRGIINWRQLLFYFCPIQFLHVLSLLFHF